MKTYGKLRERIKCCYGTMNNFAIAMQMSRSSLSCKLNDVSAWTKIEIERACKLLNIPMTEVVEYFFYE